MKVLNFFILDVKSAVRSFLFISLSLVLARLELVQLNLVDNVPKVLEMMLEISHRRCHIEYMLLWSGLDVLGDSALDKDVVW